MVCFLVRFSHPLGVHHSKRHYDYCYQPSQCTYTILFCLLSRSFCTLVSWIKASREDSSSGSDNHLRRKEEKKVKQHNCIKSTRDEEGREEFLLHQEYFKTSRFFFHSAKSSEHLAKNTYRCVMCNSVKTLAVFTRDAHVCLSVFTFNYAR